MATRVTSRLTSGWLPEAQSTLNGAVVEMVTDIHRRASMLAPKDTGALVNSGRIERNSNGNYSVVFGGNRVPYARMRHYQNKKNPQTLGYLEKAGDSVKRGNITKYVRG